MRVFIIAGEPSGDRLGGALMEGLKTLCPQVQFDGIGGAQMQAQGLASRFDMKELSVMGIAEILPKYRALKTRVNQTAAQIIETKPDVMITIDSPDFSLRVAKLVKQASDIRTVHYVAPTVWAWRAGRAAKMARYIDQVLALFPFEPALLTPHGMECDFVGHPVVAEPKAKADDIAELRVTYGIGDAPLVLVLPGSRAGEVSRLASTFGDALVPLKRAFPALKIIVPAAAPVAKDVVQAVGKWPVQAIVLDPRDHTPEEAASLKRAAFGAADVALAASGTVSLELAAARTPMVIAYKMNWLSYRIIRAMALIDTVTLVNIVSDTRVVPEFLGGTCNPQAIANGLISVLSAPQAQLAAMDITMQRLGEGGDAPGLRAARAVLERM